MTADEAHLDVVLARIEAIGNAVNSPDYGIPYGWRPSDLAGEWADAMARFRNCWEKCVQMVMSPRLLADEGVATSSIGWTGSLDTVWCPSVTLAQRQAHFSAIQARVRERARIAQILAASARVAASLAVTPMLAPVAVASLLQLIAELRTVN